MRGFVLASLASAWLAASALAQTGAGGTGVGGAGQAGQGAKAGAPGQPAMPGTTINQVPWFQNPAVQRDLRMTDPQFQQLNQQYGKLFGGFQDRISGLNSLSAAERANRLRELSGTFNTDVNRAATGLLNQQQMQRFNQLFLQQQGFGAFTDRQVQQKLNLTDPQAQQLRDAADAFDRDVAGLSRPGVGTAPEATRLFGDLVRARQNRINSILTPEQRQVFAQMTGEAFTFPAPNFSPPQTQPPKQ